MELHQLRILRELGALGSVSAVATEMAISPSAVSQQLAALQRGFATPLTRKHGRVLELTEAGAELAAAAGNVVDAMAKARAAVDEFESTRIGTVSLSGFHSVGHAVFGALLTDLVSHHPAPEVLLSDEDVAQQDFPALTARYDLVLAHRLEHSPPWPTAGLRVVRLLREPLDVAVSRRHPLAQRDLVHPEELTDERWIASRHGYSPDDVLGAIAAVANRSLNVAHRINDYGAVAALVASGDVIGLLPRYTTYATDLAQIKLLPLAGVNAIRSIDVLARPEALRRRSVRMVVAALGRVAVNLASGDGHSRPCR